MRWDAVIRGGTAVTPAGPVPADLAIVAGRIVEVAPDLAGFPPNTPFVQTNERGCQRNESAPSRPRRGRIPAVWGTTAHSQTDWDILVFS